jgi:hypothetical protein
MASGRPRRPNDPSVMASLEAALRGVARPGILGLIWNWRYELGLSAGLAVVTLASGYALGAAWLIAIGAVGLVVLAASLAWAPSRRRLIARAWCIITPHRVRAGCRHAWVQTRDGRLPAILYTTPAAFGERVTLWCQAGITHGDLEAARDVLRAACRASDVHVLASARYAHLMVLEVVRRRPDEPPDEVVPGWPYRDRGDVEEDGADPGEPALYGGPGHRRPFR